MPRTVGLGLFLVAYGNFTTLSVGTVTPIGPTLIGLPLLLVALVLAWAYFVDRLTPAQLGLARQHLVRSFGLGLLLALGAAVPALLFLHFPPLVGQSIAYAPIAAMPTDALAWRAFVWMPLDTAIPEEIAFRGVLLASLRQHSSDRAAILISAALFTAWHAVTVSRTVGLTNLGAQPLLIVLGLVGGFTAVACGGVLFAWLRMTTRNLAGSIAAHWAFNAGVLLGLGLG